jgi:RNA polymerase sigma factor (sigma-70 family)
MVNGVDSGVRTMRPSTERPAAADDRAPSPREEFNQLMAEVRAGSQDAAKKLVQIYGPHVLRIVRRWLHAKMRSKYDSEDFTQAVWASFFAFEREPTGLDSPEGLMKYLVTMAKNKVIEAFRQRMQGRQYNVQREHSFESSVMRAVGEPRASGPTPSQAALVREEMDRFMKKQPAHHLRILDLAVQGKTCNEIAAAYGLEPHSVRRIIRKFPPGLFR